MFNFDCIMILIMKFCLEFDNKYQITKTFYLTLMIKY